MPFHHQFVICPGDYIRRAGRRKTSGRMQQMLAQAGLGGQVSQFQKKTKHLIQILEKTGFSFKKMKHFLRKFCEERFSVLKTKT